MKKSQFNLIKSIFILINILFIPFSVSADSKYRYALDIGNKKCLIAKKYPPESKCEIQYFEDETTREPLKMYSCYDFKPFKDGIQFYYSASESDCYKYLSILLENE